jgi:hypothetical protein
MRWRCAAPDNLLDTHLFHHGVINPVQSSQPPFFPGAHYRRESRKLNVCMQWYKIENWNDETVMGETTTVQAGRAPGGSRWKPPRWVESSGEAD